MGHHAGLYTFLRVSPHWNLAKTPSVRFCSRFLTVQCRGDRLASLAAGTSRKRVPVSRLPGRLRHPGEHSQHRYSKKYFLHRGSSFEIGKDRATFPAIGAVGKMSLV